MKNLVASLLVLVATLACLTTANGFAFVPPHHVASVSPSAAATSTSRLFSTVVDEPVTKEKTKSDSKTTPDRAEAGTKLPAFLLRLWNDPYNKREFVARCLAEVCGKSDTESFQIMMHAHKQGMGVIGQYDFEIAELYLQSLKERSLLVDMIPVEDE